MKKIVYTIIITLITLYSCVDPYSTDSSYIKDVSALPAASYMERTDSLNLSMWVELLKYTDLYNTMNLAANYTLFVPNNTAMQAYLTKKGVSKVTDLSVEDAKILVKYHTVKGAAYSAVSFEEGMISDTTATGDYLSTSFAEDGGAVVINTKATIIKTVKTNNAYVHILNAALTPVTETIWEKLQSNDFSIFKQAVEATGYNNYLSVIYGTENNLILYKYHYTLFAVPDSVFKAHKISSFATLVDSLKSGSDYTSGTNKLNLYVGYHVFNQQISYASLAYFVQTDTKRSKNYSTMAANQLLNISEVNKVLYVDYNSTTKTGVKFLDVNQNCKNGVVHVVDNVMPVKVPKATTLKWELTDYPILASLLPKYRVSGLSTSYEYYLSSDYFTCYKWLSVPDTKPGLSYLISTKNDATLYKALNYDYLKLNLGMYGSVEMTTPTIIAGTYKVTVDHYNPSQAATIGKVGKIMFIVDGNYFGATVATQGASTTASSFLSTSVGTITFNTSTKHTVKILAIDNYVSYLDCLTFTP
jgi:uncharacterized surface protein with fasciclin (FAS1) repeats